MDPSVELPVPIPTGPPPGGALPEYVPPPDGIPVEALDKLAHDYIHTNKRVDDIALELAVSTRDVRSAIKRYGLDRRKAEIIRQVQQEELAAYQQFLLEHRVDTAEEHRRISQKVNKAAEALLDKATAMPAAELLENVKQLKAVAGLFKSLSETLANSTGVGARAVALSGLTAEQSGGLSLVGAAGKKPLVALSFTVQAPDRPAPPAAQRLPETIDAEFTQET